MSDLPIFAGLEPRKWKVCVPRLGGFGTVERNTGPWPVRPAGILPAAASERSQRSENSAWANRLENLCSSADGTAQLIERLAAGENIALVTDAGMPGLSDPGGRLIRECIRRDLPFTIVPGPSSILTAIVGSGFSTEKFFFAGFLPVKSGGRERELRGAASRDGTTVFFESPYRLMKTLRAAIGILQDRQLCVARELTKKFEEFRHGSAAELLAHYQAHPPKGEIVLVIQGAAAS